MEVAEFHDLLRTDMDRLVDEVVLVPGAPHFTDAQIQTVASALTTKFQTIVSSQHIYVVGSAKLGFALHSKNTGGEQRPAFRAFSADSDIDLAIVCPGIFDQIWTELSGYAHRQNGRPWDSNKLGDYLVYGWLRPDLFPKGRSLMRCDDWWNVFRALSADSSLGRRPIRGGLFYSHEQLRKYQLKGLQSCLSNLDLMK